MSKSIIFLLRNISRQLGFSSGTRAFAGKLFKSNKNFPRKDNFQACSLLHFFMFLTENYGKDDSSLSCCG